MWSALRRSLARFLRWTRQSGADRRSLQSRERFWREVRAGEREAEANDRS